MRPLPPKRLLLGFSRPCGDFESLADLLPQLAEHYSVDLCCSKRLADSLSASSGSLIAKTYPYFAEPEPNMPAHTLHQNMNFFVKTLDRFAYSQQIFIDQTIAMSRTEDLALWCDLARQGSLEADSAQKLLIGFHHGLGDFIAFTPALRYLATRYESIDLCCTAALAESGLLDFCPYLEKVLPILKAPWSRDRPGALAQNSECYREILAGHPYDRHIYLQDFWEGKKPEVFVKLCCVSALGFNPQVDDNWRLEIWPETNSSVSIRPQDSARTPYLFLHNDSPTWPLKRFHTDSLPEVTEFNGTITNTSAETFASINDAFRCLAFAERVVIADSVFMWAAWALNKPIDYLHYVDIDERVRPLDRHRDLIKRCNLSGA